MSYKWPQITQKPDKNEFAFIVAFQSILKRATNQNRESPRKRLPLNLVLVNKRMLVYKLIEQDLYSRQFVWNKLNFLQELIFTSTSPRDTSRTSANIYDWEICNNSWRLLTEQSRAALSYCFCISDRWVDDGLKISLFLRPLQEDKHASNVQYKNWI